MIEGVIHHITEMEIDRQYVDSHGQSEVAFAFCRLLGFALLPRARKPRRRKANRPQRSQRDRALLARRQTSERRRPRLKLRGLPKAVYNQNRKSSLFGLAAS